MLVFGSNKQQAVAALEQRGRDDRLTQDDFNKSLSGLPSDALVRAYVNAQELINGSPGTETARKVKWVSALRTVGLTVSSQSDGISIDFNAKTDSSQLTDADLPIASGDASPPVSTKAGEIGLGIRGLDQTERWAESVAQAVSPTSYSNFVANKKKIKSQFGLDLDKDLIDQLSGNASISLDIQGHFAARVEPKDPAALVEDARQVRARGPAVRPGQPACTAPSSHACAGSTGSPAPTASPSTTAWSGRCSPLEQPRLAGPDRERHAPAGAGAKGAVAISSDIGKVLSEVISQAAGGGLGGSFGGSLATAPLGNLTGWFDSSTSGITGHEKLEIR